ncbi:unnamed protein product [Arctogadus glacialis]
MKRHTAAAATETPQSASPRRHRSMPLLGGCDLDKMRGRRAREHWSLSSSSDVRKGQMWMERFVHFFRIDHSKSQYA